jgi:hypothetical protein
VKVRTKIANLSGNTLNWVVGHLIDGGDFRSNQPAAVSVERQRKVQILRVEGKGPWLLLCGFSFELENRNVMGQAVEECAGETFGAEHLGPFVDG